MYILTKKSGSILILALWTMAFLGVFAVHIGVKIRQRAELLSRLENKSQLRYIASSGIKKAIAALKADWNDNKKVYTANNKFFRQNNPQQFKGKALGNGVYNVLHTYSDESLTQTLYGMVEEESKLNINTASERELRRLIQNIIRTDVKEAKSLSLAIIEWREFGKTELTGFYSDDYYENLKYSYEPKNAEFEVIEELLLVRGFHRDIFDKLLPFITIYGDGMVNINTAPKEVLLALGLDRGVSDKLLSVRKGDDGIESTEDDYIFHKTYDIASEINHLLELNISEIKQIDALNTDKKIKTNAFHYFIKSQAIINQNARELTVFCVYNLNKNRIEYWKEK